MRKKWFIRMLLSYIPIFFLITSFLFFVFFQLLNEQNKKEAVKTNGIVTEQVKQVIDYSLSSIDYAIIGEMMNNETVLHYISTEQNPEIIQIYQLTEMVRRFKQVHPLIDSIYLVRLQDNAVLNEGVTTPLDQFADQAFIHSMLGEKVSFHWTNARIYRDSAQSNSRQVVTLIRKVYVSTGEPGLIVVNVGVKAIQKQMQETYDPNFSFVDIADPNGHSFFANEGVTSTSVGTKGTSRILSESKSDYTGWEYRGGLVRGELVNVISTFSRIWVVLGLLATVIGIVSIVYITWNNYKPIDDIITRIRSSSSHRISELKKSGGNEFAYAYIESALDQMIGQIVQYQEQSKEELIMKRKHFFYEIIEGNSQLTMSDWGPAMDKLQLSAHFDEQVIIVMVIDRYVDFYVQYNERDQNLLKFVLSNVIQENAQNLGMSVWVEWTSSQQLTGLFQVVGDEEQRNNRVLRACEGFMQWVKHNLKVTVTIGIGKPFTDVAQISNAYHRTLGILKYKAVMGNNQIISYSDIEQQAPPELLKHLQYIRTIIQDFRLGNKNWADYFTLLFQEIRNDMLSREDTASLMKHFVYKLDQELGNLDANVGKLWKEHGFSRLNEIVASFDTVNDIEEEFMRILPDFYQQIDEIKERRSHYALTNRVKIYIEENFRDRNLSLVQLSEQFEVNPKYLSQLFKEELGENFVDFVIRLRVEYSKNLLRNTSDTVQEISTKVGYSTSISFGRIFKKVEGISPGDFRKMRFP